MQLTLGVQLRWFVLLGYLEHALQYTLSPCSLAAIAESTHTHTLFYIAHPATACPPKHPFERVDPSTLSSVLTQAPLRAHPPGTLSNAFTQVPFQVCPPMHPFEHILSRASPTQTPLRASPRHPYEHVHPDVLSRAPPTQAPFGVRSPRHPFKRAHPCTLLRVSRRHPFERVHPGTLSSVHPGIFSSVSTQASFRVCPPRHPFERVHPGTPSNAST